MTTHPDEITTVQPAAATAHTHRTATGRRMAMFGAPLDTGNLGVSALGTATLAAVTAAAPDTRLTVFDYQRGTGSRVLNVPAGTIRYERRGAYRSRRRYRPENLQTMLLASRVAPRLHPTLRAIDRCTDVLDISGGDSFTDLYGPKRFLLVTLPKRIALGRRIPLHLLPQTYGPFTEAPNRDLAATIVAEATTAWARDPHSFARLRELLGARFDPDRHRCGVDIAFLLPRREPPPSIADAVRTRTQAPGPVVGINLSGLLTNRPQEANQRFGLRADHLTAMTALVRRFLRETDAHVVLVPHVRGREQESDDVACRRLATSLADPERVSVLPTGLDAMETKWVISRLDWFAGARMHATIAALSSQVPVAAVAYSDKALGVFGTCGVAEQVVDARRLTTDDLTDALWTAWLQRGSVRETLHQTVPGVIARADEPIAHILGPRS